MRIGAVCGSYHREDVECMLVHAQDEAKSLGISIEQVVWVPGSMETPLALKRMLDDRSLDGAIALGIIERGETQHGLAMGQAVIRSIIDLQLETGLPIGLGIIGPGAAVCRCENQGTGDGQQEKPMAGWYLIRDHANAPASLIRRNPRCTGECSH